MNSNSGLNWAVRVLLVCTALSMAWAVFNIGRTLAWRWSLRSDNTRYMIVSSRDPSADLGLIELAAKSRILSYQRFDDPFAAQLLRGYRVSDITAAHKGIGVFFGPEGKLTQKAEGPESIRGAVEAAEREVGAATIPALYLLLLLGGLVGSFVKPRALSVKSLLASAAVLSFCQFWYHCPTCPQVEIFGVPLGLLGAIIYSAAALPRITERYSIWIGIMSSAGCVLQVLLVQAYDTTCLWCAFIGGINSFLAVVCLLTRVQTQPIVSRRSSTFVGASLFAALAIAVGAKNFMRTPGKQNSFVQPAPTLVGLNLADLHLTAQKSEEVVMFIADGCQPCHDALSVLQRSGVNPRYVFCGQVPAGYIGKAERVDGNTIRTTPTFAFVGPTGLISAERVGWPEDQERQSELLSMVSAVAKRGSSQSHKNALGRLQ